MNDQKIYELIAKHNRVRAVQIADWLDEDLSDVSHALRGLVEVGDVVQDKGLGPSGHPSMFYELSADFKRSQAYRLIMSTLEAKDAPPAAAPAPAAPVDQPAVDLPQQRTKVDRGVAYVLQNGTATDEQLRVAMDLPRTSPPAAYLASAIKAGRIYKEGGIWRPSKPIDGTKFNQQPIPKRSGPVAQFGADTPIEYPAGTVLPAGAPAAPSPFDALLNAPEKPAAPVVDVPVTVKAETPAPAAPIETSMTVHVGLAVDARVTVQADVQDEPVPAEPVYRAALWSDGVLELQRDGSTVLTCTRGEGEFLAGFLARTLGEVSKAA